jgi:hypothetical protein
MADGLSTVNLANAWLNVLDNTAFSAIAATYIQLHTGTPGASGTSNVSSVTTREAVTWSAASGAVLTASNTPTWTSWAGTNGEVVTDISIWSASTSGTFYFSCPLAGTAYNFTATNATPCVFTAPGSSYSNGTTVVLTAIAAGSIPTGFTGDTIYFVVSASGITFELSATSGGSAINSSSTGAGIVQADGSKTVNTGDTLEVTALSVSLSPLAA